MKNNNITIIALTQLILLSCATNENPETGTTKSYSGSTEREFESIERSDYSKMAPGKNTSPEVSPDKTKMTMALKPAKVSPPLNLSAKNDERIQEINQNLAFFCMKNTNNSRFKTEEQCQAYAKKVLLLCEKKYSVINNRLVNCIKSRLKKR